MHPPGKVSQAVFSRTRLPRPVSGSWGKGLCGVYQTREEQFSHDRRAPLPSEAKRLWATPLEAGAADRRGRIPSSRSRARKGSTFGIDGYAGSLTRGCVYTICSPAAMFGKTNGVENSANKVSMTRHDIARLACAIHPPTHPPTHPPPTRPLIARTKTLTRHANPAPVSSGEAYLHVLAPRFRGGRHL